MSTTYPTLTETSFPESVDNITRMSDLTTADLSLYNQYNEYLAAGNLQAAAALLTANQSLIPKVFNAAKFNRLADGIVAVQQLFKDDVDGYIQAKQNEFDAAVAAFCWKLDWSASVAYKEKNICRYSNNTYLCLTDHINHAPSPTGDTVYWALIAPRGVQGIQGVSGTGLAPRGLWNSLTEYYADDCVAYGNALWQSVATNKDSEPSEANEDWLKLLTVDLSALNAHMENTNIHVTAAEKAEWSGKQDAITVEGAPQKDNTNPISSGGVYTALENFSTCPFHAAASPPENTNLLWIDTTESSGGLKYYNGSGWATVPVRYAV